MQALNRCMKKKNVLLPPLSNERRRENSSFLFHTHNLELSFSLSLIRYLTFFPLSLSFSRSLSKTPLANAFHTFHTTSYLPHERRSKGLHEICFIIISHIVTDFCFFLRRILVDVIKL